MYKSEKEFSLRQIKVPIFGYFPFVFHVLFDQILLTNIFEFKVLAHIKEALLCFRSILF